MMLSTTLIVTGIATATVGAIIFYISKKYKISQKIQPQTNTITPETSKE